MGLTGTPLLAGERSFDCAFTTECIDSECQDSSYAGSLSANATTHSGHWTDSAETIDLAVAEQDGVTMASEPMAQGRTQRILTIMPEGAARYTVHVTDPAIGAAPLALTYLGQCREAS